jgi:hypothetical protein
MLAKKTGARRTLAEAEHAATLAHGDDHDPTCAHSVDGECNAFRAGHRVRAYLTGSQTLRSTLLVFIARHGVTPAIWAA